MRRGIVIVGIALAVLGVLLVGAGYVVGGASQSQTLTPLPTDLCLHAQGVGTSTLSVSWSGGAAGSQVVLASANSDCSAVSSSIDSGTGPSGSFTASLTSGSTYAIYVTGASAPVNVTYTVSGFSYLMLIGVILVALGAILAVFGFRARSRDVGTMEHEPAAEASAESTPYARPPPLAPSTVGTAPTAPPVRAVAAAPVAAASATRLMAGDDTATTVPRFMPASDGQPPAAAAPATGARPAQTCAYCGTVNESWITNCRKCKRPLSSTATG